MATNSLNDILQLGVAERIQLVEDIWDRIAATPDSIVLIDSQVEELDRRLAAFERDPEAGSSWNDVKFRVIPRL